MALFMDMHDLKAAVALDDVAKAHAADLATQDAYGALSALLGGRARRQDLLPRGRPRRRDRDDRASRRARTGCRRDIPGHRGRLTSLSRLIAAGTPYAVAGRLLAAHNS